MLRGYNSNSATIMNITNINKVRDISKLTGLWSTDNFKNIESSVAPDWGCSAL